MGTRGPAPKDRRVRDRDNIRRQKISADGQVRGIDLPADALEDDESEWHPRVREWWEALRRSAPARLLADESWHDLLRAARLHQDFWAGKARGRTLRSAELRAVLSAHLLDPASLRRGGYEPLLPVDLENPDGAQVLPMPSPEDRASRAGSPDPTTLAARRKRLLDE